MTALSTFHKKKKSIDIGVSIFVLHRKARKLKDMEG